MILNINMSILWCMFYCITHKVLKNSLKFFDISLNMWKFISHHNMNMFLFYFFIRARWFEDFSYSFRFWWLIVLVLLLDSFVFSVALEWVKKALRYDRLTAAVETRLQSLTAGGGREKEV